MLYHTNALLITVFQYTKPHYHAFKVEYGLIGMQLLGNSLTQYMYNSIDGTKIGIHIGIVNSSIVCPSHYLYSVHQY
jgi:hypothetical protein